MARQPRERSESGIYHVTFRGNNREYIFKGDNEKRQLLLCIEKVKFNGGFELYAYCIMDNHGHLIIKETTDDISNVMKRIKVRYSGWYNYSHGRLNHVFGDRFHSEPIEDDTYLMSVLAYVFQNPVKAYKCKKPEEYRWSSYRSLKEKREDKIIDCEALEEVIDFPALFEYTEFKTITGHID